MKAIILIISLIPIINLGAQDLTMLLSNSEIDGTTLTYDVRVENFSDMLSMQYGIVYDSDVLTFVEFQNMDILGLAPQNFNAAVPGEIRMLWIDLTLQGVTLEDGALIYQIVFELQGSDPGDVCYSEDPLIIEFVNLELELPSFMITDDCHTEPYTVSLITSAARGPEYYGLSMSTLANDNALQISLSQPRNLKLQIFDVSGRLMKSFPDTDYFEGKNVLNFESPLPSGVYILHTVIEGTPVSLKFVQ